MATSSTAEQVLDTCYLEIRAKVIEIAASLDRIDRAEDSGRISDDPRMQRIRKGVEILTSRRLSRAEQIQLVFSDEYDPDWNH